MLTKPVSSKMPEVAIGDDEATASAIEAMGGQHKNCTVDMIHLDEKNNIVTMPAYMLGPGIEDVAQGVEKWVAKVVASAG